MLTERSDHMDEADGTRVMSFPLAGMLAAHGGTIVRRSDCIDPPPGS